MKSGSKFDFKKFLVQKSIFDPSGKQILLWSSRDTYLVEETKENDDFKSLYLLKQPQQENELILLKKFESIVSSDLTFRESNSYLVYSKFLGKNVNLIFNFFVKYLELLNRIIKNIINFKFSFTENCL